MIQGIYVSCGTSGEWEQTIDLYLTILPRLLRLRHYNEYGKTELGLTPNLHNQTDMNNLEIAS